MSTSPASIDVSPLLNLLRESQRQAIDQAVIGVNEGTEMIGGNAQTICPNRTGTLAGSQTTTPCTIDGSGLHGEVGFNTDYAAAVHENVTAKFSTEKTPLAQAKFLEKSMILTGPRVLQNISNRVKAVVGNNG